jgi:putative transposase
LSHGGCREVCLQSAYSLSSGEAFVALDRLLDMAGSGPVYLRRPEIAALLTEQLQQVSARGLCSLHAYVIMPNHVHLLWSPQIPLADLIRQVKGATAFRANKLLGRSGERFWQPEYFDRMVRNEKEFAQIQRYIEWNRAPRRVETQRVRGPHQEVIGYAWIANERRSLATDCAEAS